MSSFGDQPRKGDVSVAKSYLSEAELRAVNLIVSRISTSRIGEGGRG